jgi:hypothetical protein
VAAFKQSVCRSARRAPRSALALVWVAVAASSTRADHSASTAVYVRQDTDHTNVISPRLKLRSSLLDDETHLDLAYSVDVWTSASVDIVASASEPVTEQRDELDLGLDRTFGDLTLAGHYRYSTEPDYESHGGSVGVSWDLANKAVTLAWTAGGSVDRVGRAGDVSFREDVNTLSTGVSLTQVVDVDTLFQVLYDLSAVRGYQASAYRYVAFGSSGPCHDTSEFCLPEQNPRERLRHALAARVRRALGLAWSAGGGYRFYLDDWGIVSHTAKADLSWAPQRRSTLALSYRFYTQSAADHYRAQYLESDIGLAYYTRDKELSPLSSQRVALEFDWVWELAHAREGLLTGLAVATTFYHYRDFAMLTRSTAFEVTAVTGMEFE